MFLQQELQNSQRSAPFLSYQHFIKYMFEDRGRNTDILGWNGRRN